MGNSYTTIRCGNCNKVLAEEERPCPSCGSERRNYSAAASRPIGITAKARFSATTRKEFYETNRKTKYLVIALCFISPAIGLIVGLFLAGVVGLILGFVIGLLTGGLSYILPPAVTRVREVRTIESG